MEAKTCPRCQISIAPTPDGRCPICRQPLDAPVESRAAAPEVAANPFAAPTAARPPEPPAAPAGKQPFTHQAAKFSFYSLAVLILLNVVFKAQVDANRGTDLGWQLALAWRLMSLLTMLSGFTFGLIGLVGGITRGKALTIVVALLGLLINGALLGVAAFAFLRRF